MNIQVDWNAYLSSSWNKQAILLLAREFVEEFQQKKHAPLAYNALTMPLKSIIKSINTKLQRPRKEYILSNQPSDSMDVFNLSSFPSKLDDELCGRRGISRRGTRRNTVSYALILITLGY